MDRFHSRSRPARGVIASWDQPTIVFLTVCTKNRYPWLAQPEPHRVLVEVWRSLSDWKVSRYVLMPDHLHFFAWPGSYGISFDRWVTAWKAKASRTNGQQGFSVAVGRIPSSYPFLGKCRSKVSLHAQ